MLTCFVHYCAKLLKYNTGSIAYAKGLVLLLYSYPYGGSVPVNLARLHASVAHYSTSQDAYRVKVMCASGCEEVAQLVRSIADETRSQSEVLVSCKSYV